jgi:hypothetical protein
MITYASERQLTEIRLVYGSGSWHESHVESNENLLYNLRIY